VRCLEGDVMQHSTTRLALLGVVGLALTACAGTYAVGTPPPLEASRADLRSRRCGRS